MDPKKHPMFVHRDNAVVT